MDQTNTKSSSSNKTGYCLPTISNRSAMGDFKRVKSAKDLLVSSSSEDGSKRKKNPQVVCFGELLIDFVPTVSGVSLAEAPGFKKAPGGAPANVAVCVSKLGGSAGMRFDKQARTALAFVTLRADGEREFMFFRHPSADMLLTEAELDTDLIKKSTIFHYGSISLIEDPCKSAHLAAMKIAKKQDAFFHMILI
ncbi:unnamed protein product [Lactuca saligna]|uniref:Carbohydrate kinase PfkB domain-containing protein n=1 Tax=Lactuca saligna TaxID=75948 RepID=A0AA35UYZ0_LACSI|nr:unnamed protein product [Lactuca saligna]